MREGGTETNSGEVRNRDEEYRNNREKNRGWEGVRIMSGVDSIPTIADRGTSVNLVSEEVALRLVKEGVVDRIENLKKKIIIQFGVESAKENAVGMIKGKGLIGDVFVIKGQLPVMLISDITFTEKGVVLIQDDSRLIGIANGEVVVVGIRVPGAARTNTEAMWQLDLRALLKQPDPRITAKAVELSEELTARIIVQKIQSWSENGKEREGVLDDEVQMCAVARPRFATADVRLVRKFLKNVGISPFSIVRSVENEALRNVPEWLTTSLLRAIGHARDSIPAAISTARRHQSGGTGIKCTEPGAVFSFDIIGPFLASTWGCRYGVMIVDEATGYAEGFGIVNKSDLLEVVRKYCQSVDARGKGPVTRARCDAASEISRNGELVAECRRVCEELHLQIVPSAPADQQTNPVERGWQCISQRMTNMFLQQNNLTKDKWLLIWFCAIVLDRCVCRVGQTKTPCELMCGIVPDVEHFAKFFCGETVMMPRTTDKTLLSPRFEVGVVILPILSNKAHLVLLGNSKTPQVRANLRSVGPELQELSAAELQRLKPTFDEETGELLDFHSRTNQQFSLPRAIRNYDDGVDLVAEGELSEAEAGESLAEIERRRALIRQEVQRYKGPVRRSDRLRESGRQGSEIVKEDGGGAIGVEKYNASKEEGGRVRGEHVERNEEDEAEALMQGEEENVNESELAEEEKIDELKNLEGMPLYAVNWATMQQALNETVLSLFDAQRTERVVEDEVLTVGKARIVHTADNPTPGMLERDPILAERWREATRREIDGGILKGFRFLITEEERIRDGWIPFPLVLVYSVKRDGTLKCRAATDGSIMPKDMFDEDYLYAEGLPTAVLRLLSAFAVYFRMIDRTTDVEACFAALNTWDKARYPRLVCHKLTAYQSPTGKEEWMANLTNNYGGRDGPGQWREISTDVLINKAGFVQSVVCKQVFLRFRGDQSLIILGQITDDFKLIHTSDEGGHAMYAELMHVLQVECGWGMTEQNPTKDFGSIVHEFADIGGRRAVTLTQPTQIEKLTEMLFGTDRASVPETYLPLPVDWSAEASAQCEELVTNKEFMKHLMSASWITQTRFESPAIGLLACRAQRPTVVDMEAVKHHVAYLWTTRECGVTYYEGPKEADIRKTLQLRLYTDSGENQHLDGAAHWGGLAFLGDEKDCPGSGAIMGHSQKASGVVGESVPINELMGTAAFIKIAILLKYLLEEFSGATRNNWQTTEMRVEGSAEPMRCGVSEAVNDAMKHVEPGKLGEPAMDAASIMISKKQQSGDEQSVIRVYGDNQGVVDNLRHTAKVGKGLRRATRIVSFMQSLMEEKIVSYEKVASVDQRADLLTKKCTSPVQNADAMGRVLGNHPAVEAFGQKVHLKCNKRRNNKRKSEEVGLQEEEERGVRRMCMQANVAGKSVSEVTRASETEQNEMGWRNWGSVSRTLSNLQQRFGWLRSGGKVAAAIMARWGYNGSRGLGRQEQGVIESNDVVRRQSQIGYAGLGFGEARILDRETQGVHSKIKERIALNACSVSVNEEKNKPAEAIFLAERIRRALQKLTMEERWLFNTRLHAGPFQDLMLTQEKMNVEMKGGNINAVQPTVVGEVKDHGKGRTWRKNKRIQQNRRQLGDKV